MSGSSHHFIPGFSSVQGGMQYGGSMQNQLGNTMQNQLGNQMQVSLSNQMNTQSNSNQMMQQMNPMMNSSQMYGSQNQQYGVSQHQSQNSYQLQPQSQMSGLQHHSMQQPVMQQTSNVITPTPPPQQQQQQQQQGQQQSNKELNTASLCRIGQETVQDIVSRTQEVFQTLKAIQPPNGTPQGTNTSNERKVKVQEQLRTIRVLLKRLRLIYEKCNENCQMQGMEYTHVESLIPYKDDIDPKHDEKKNSEVCRVAYEECKEVMEQVILKNRQLKEVIDHLRRIIWEINTMLTMRRS